MLLSLTLEIQLTDCCRAEPWYGLRSALVGSLTSTPASLNYAAQRRMLDLVASKRGGECCIPGTDY